jgi:hypothetical protein
MFNLPYTDVDYCRYSEWGYKKRTRIWTNSGYQGKTLFGRWALCFNGGGTAPKERATMGYNF